MKGWSYKCKLIHKLFGHLSKAKIRAVEKFYEVKLTEKFKVCSDCVEAKTRAEAFPKTVDDRKRNKISGERLCFDVSTIKVRSLGGAEFGYWCWMMPLLIFGVISSSLSHKSKIK